MNRLSPFPAVHVRPFRSIVLPLIAISVAVTVCEAQTPTPSADWSADSAAIAQASRAWMRALQAKDRPALDSLMAPEFALDAPGADGAPLSREEWLHNAFTILETDSADYTILRVRRLGPDLAVSTGQLYWKVRLRGVPLPARHNFTDTWVRRDGRWQVAARDANIAEGSLAMITLVAGLILGGLGWLLVTGIRWFLRRRRQGVAA